MNAGKIWQFQTYVRLGDAPVGSAEGETMMIYQIYVPMCCWPSRLLKKGARRRPVTVIHWLRREDSE
ncbi:hypothetical protein XI06_14855, partial [Bradyrhizobium sp. CCBAU 11434]|nr:hypothetical protein [Bradyrhizobium sp. CCBAU 11434]